MTDDNDTDALEPQERYPSAAALGAELRHRCEHVRGGGVARLGARLHKGLHRLAGRVGGVDGRPRADEAAEDAEERGDIVAVRRLGGQREAEGPHAMQRSRARPVKSWSMAKLELMPRPSRKSRRTVVPEPLGATRITSTLSGATTPVMSE